MINRNRTSSQYIFNSKTGALEKATDITKMPAKQAEKKNEDIDPVTSIIIITAADNIMHNYFYSYEMSWDASSCLQIAKIKTPKMGQKHMNYWSSYSGLVTIYIGYNFTFDNVNGTTHTTEQDIAESLIKYWNNSNIKPYFRGEVDKIKEYKNDTTIYIKSIGGRFQQEIPEKFRQSYINGQNVRDAFQAICEFLGVQYICPPKSITDSGGEETSDTTTNNDGTENDVGQQINNANQLASAARNTANQNSQNNNQNSQSNNANTPNAQNTQDNTQDNQSSTGLEQEINDIMNGYDDINFDANGAITHASAIIETSPDVSHTLAAMETHPFERYIDDETGIVEKVNNFLNGEMFDELHPNVMDYGAITIEPKSTTTSEMSTVDTGTTNDQMSQNDNSSSDSSNSSSSSSRTATSVASRTPTSTGQKGVWGKTSKGSFYLTQDAINKMSMAEAKRRYEDGQKRHIYTAATMQKLWYRMMFGTKFF